MYSHVVQVKRERERESACIFAINNAVSTRSILYRIVFCVLFRLHSCRKCHYSFIISTNLYQAYIRFQSGRRKEVVKCRRYYYKQQNDSIFDVRQKIIQLFQSLVMSKVYVRHPFANQPYHDIRFCVLTIVKPPMLKSRIPS
jgi:hypothetical protein